MTQRTDDQMGGHGRVDPEVLSASANYLCYGDNLDILHRMVRDETVDLCYIDPPFNSQRRYIQIYNNIGSEALAQAQAFVDTWTWDDHAQDGYREILSNEGGRYRGQTVELIKGLRSVLGQGSLLAYLISMTRRFVEIHRVLKPTGSFYLHCDPTASHYLKLVLDTIFCSTGGDFINEIVWHYRRWTGKAKKFQELHDTVFFYVKSSRDYKFNVLYTSYTQGSKQRKEQGVLHRFKAGDEPYLVSDGTIDQRGVRENDVWQIPFVAPSARERLGYPTQKPEALLERIIRASSNEGDLVLDAYCGCGTTVAMAQRLGRRWIGMDITYQSISLILRRLEDTFGKDVAEAVHVDGVPRDMASAVALAHKSDDRLRKEFEKWAVLTFTRNRAAINHKKGADAGIDATAYFLTSKEDNAKVVFHVKSGDVGRGDIATLKGDMEREGAELATLITLKEPTQPMRSEAKGAGIYAHKLTGRNYDRVQIVTIREILEEGKRLEILLALEVLKTAIPAEDEVEQGEFALEPKPEKTRIRACDCSEPDPVMQADGKFYCHRCSFQTGARPHLELEDALRRAKAAEEARDAMQRRAQSAEDDWQCAEEARAQLEPVSPAEPKKSNDGLLPLLRVVSSAGAGEWLNFEKLAMVEAELAAKAEESRAHLAQSIEKLEAELLMVKQFLHEPGTDLEAWVDGCLARVKALAALVPTRPEKEKT